MNAKTRISKTRVSVAILIVCGAAVWLWQSHKSTPQAVTPPQPTPAVQVATTPPVPEVAPPENPQPAKPVAVEAPAVKPKAPKTALNQPSLKPPKEPLHDPDARDALALVGLDPQAEQYWLQAIFDTSLPDKEREDLMEDLNEVGFADPKNLSPDDLPLIASRLQIIEQLEPNVDPFMKQHLDEAYKDLQNMYGQVTGQ